MATATVETRKTNTKQPQPVHGVARWIGGTATQGQLVDAVRSQVALLDLRIKGLDSTLASRSSTLDRLPIAEAEEPRRAAVLLPDAGRARGHLEHGL